MSVHQTPCLDTPQFTCQPILSLVVAREGPATVVEVRGEIDMATVGPLVDLVSRVMTSEPPVVLVLDLSGVTFFCAAGVTALLIVRRRVAANGCVLMVREPSRITATVLNLVGLGDEFTTE